MTIPHIEVSESEIAHMFSYGECQLTDDEVETYGIEDYLTDQESREAGRLPESL